MKLEWKRVEPTKVDTVSWRTIVTKRFEQPDGVVREYGTFRSASARHIATVAITPDNKVVLAKQFRPGPEQICYELPGGGPEKGEELIDAETRELLEETGYMAGQIELLGKCYKDAYTNAAWYYFLATDCVVSPHGQQTDDTEFIEVVTVSVEELLSYAKNAQMTDVEGVFLALDKLKDLQHE